jgi:hypothetical protein
MKKLNRIGEKYITNEGYEIIIIEYFSAINCTIQFKDGYVVKNKRYGDILRGQVKNINHKKGEKYFTNEGYEIEIIKINGWGSCTIKFNAGNIVDKINYGAIKNGSVKNPMHKSICGIGYLGTTHNITILNKNYSYKIWKHMIERCYSEKEKLKFPSYENVSVCEEWHNFSNYTKWYEENYNPEYMQSWHLDKDILIKGSKLYSPETCCFVPQEINLLFIKNNINRGKYPIGVTPNRINRFVSKIVKNNKTIHLGTFDTPEEAFETYKVEKEKYIKEVADRWKGLISEKVYEAMYNYKVEITD